MKETRLTKILVFSALSDQAAELGNLLETNSFICEFTANTDILFKNYLEDKSYEMLIILFDERKITDMTLVSRIRNVSNIPIIAIRKDDELKKRILALELGADKILAYPYDQRELLATLQTTLRCYRSLPAGKNISTTKTPSPIINSQTYKFADFEYDAGQMQLKGPRGKPKDLTAKECKLLEVFLKAPQKVLSRDQIYELLYDRASSNFDRSIDVLVSRLRKKLKYRNTTSPIIKTVRGIGYMLLPDVIIL